MDRVSIEDLEEATREMSEITGIPLLLEATYGYVRVMEGTNKDGVREFSEPYRRHADLLSWMQAFMQGWETNPRNKRSKDRMSGSAPIGPQVPTVEYNGWNVLAKEYHGDMTPVKYGNRTQAQRKAADLGPGWEVLHFGRPFYVGFK